MNNWTYRKSFEINETDEGVNVYFRYESHMIFLDSFDDIKQASLYINKNIRKNADIRQVGTEYAIHNFSI